MERRYQIVNRLVPKVRRETCPDQPDSFYSAGCTKHQPWRHHLGRFRVHFFQHGDEQLDSLRIDPFGRFVWDEIEIYPYPPIWLGSGGRLFFVSAELSHSLKV